MRILTFIVFSCLMANAALAAKIEDAQVLDVKLSKETFEVKMRDPKRAPEGHFFVKVVKEDKEAFEKMALILKKLNKKDNFKLVLEVASFSAKPAGSQYKSTYVKFEGSAQDESLVAH